MAVELSGDGVHRLHPAAFYCIFFLCICVRINRLCWKSVFHLPNVRTSAIKILLLRLLFVVQSVLIGALLNDLTVQYVHSPRESPRLPMWLVGLIATVCEAVFALTKSFEATLKHTIMSHLIPFLSSSCLHLLYLKRQVVDQGEEVLYLYAASVLAVFWRDIEEHAFTEDGGFISFGEMLRLLPKWRGARAGARTNPSRSGTSSSSRRSSSSGSRSSDEDMYSQSDDEVDSFSSSSADSF